MKKISELFSENEKYIISAILFMFAILTLFFPIENGNESHGVWALARIHLQADGFAIKDPLYVACLKLFLGLGYPTGVIVEHLILAVLTTLSMFLFLRNVMRSYFALFITLLWVPFIFLNIEGRVLIYSLDFAMLAVAARTNNYPKYLSYFLFLLAYVFRNQALIFIIFFGAYDLVTTYRRGGLAGLKSELTPRLTFIPSLILLLVLFVVVPLNPSKSPKWNNHMISAVKWFPGQGEKAPDTAFLFGQNATYLQDKYPKPEVFYKDYYFSNKKLFGDAQTIRNAFLYNPVFVIKTTMRSAFRNFAFYLLQYTPFFEFPELLTGLPMLVKFFAYGFTSLFFFVIYFGAYQLVRATPGNDHVIFLIAAFFATLASALVWSSMRYCFLLAPGFALGFFWLSSKIVSTFSRWNYFVLVLLLLIFSPIDSLKAWASMVSNIATGEMRVLESVDGQYAWKRHHNELDPLIRDCKGLISMEHMYFTAFSSLPFTRIYDIWAIPPFGSLDNSPYTDLTEDKIDCVFISRVFAEMNAYATTTRPRLEHYILPYAARLKKEGAVTYKIGELGELIKLPHHANTSQ